MDKRRSRPRTFLVALAAAGAVLLAAVPSRSVSPLPLRCDAAGWITFLRPQSTSSGSGFLINATGTCAGDLSGPYTAIVTGSGGSCLSLGDISGINPCVDSTIGVTLKLTSQKTGKTRTLKQRWVEAVSLGIPFVVEKYDPASVPASTPIGAGLDLTGAERWCRQTGDYTCRYDYRVIWVFLT